MQRTSKMTDETPKLGPSRGRRSHVAPLPCGPQADWLNTRASRCDDATHVEARRLIDVAIYNDHRRLVSKHAALSQVRSPALLNEDLDDLAQVAWLQIFLLVHGRRKFPDATESHLAGLPCILCEERASSSEFPSMTLHTCMIRRARTYLLDYADKLARRPLTSQVSGPPEVERLQSGRGTNSDIRIEQRRRLEHVRRGLAKLPEGARRVAELVLFEGQSHEEAARSLNITVATSRSRLGTARRALREYDARRTHGRLSDE